MSIKQKYLKDENGELFSPVTSIDSVYNSNGEKVPQIVAWCFAKMNASGVATLQAGSNISEISMVNTGTYRVNFRTNIKDVNYAALVCCEAGGNGQEIIGVYQHRTDSFLFDVTNHSGTAIIPAEINIIVVR